jgi:hypothetical protein
LKLNNQRLEFIYFGEEINGIDVFGDGDFFLKTKNGKSYHISPFHYLNSEGLFCFDQVLKSSDLSILNGKIRTSFPSQFSSFQATLCYLITWSIQVILDLTFYQVALCTDLKSSFMIVSYAKTDVLSDTFSSFYFDPLQQETVFLPSTNESNCNAPGQFIFQLNDIPQNNGLKINFFY